MFLDWQVGTPSVAQGPRSEPVCWMFSASPVINAAAAKSNDMLGANRYVRPSTHSLPRYCSLPPLKGLPAVVIPLGVMPLASVPLVSTLVAVQLTFVMARNVRAGVSE